MSTKKMHGCEIFECKVLPEWIDYNGHMNVAWYVLAFDLGVDELWSRFGVSQEYVERTNNSTFAVEAHINYLQEVCLDDPLTLTSQVLAYDDKRIHHYMRMYHAEKKYLAATIEWMNLHVDLDRRRVSPWPEHIVDGIRSFVGEQGNWALPDNLGHRIEVNGPLWHTAGYKS